MYQKLLQLLPKLKGLFSFFGFLHDVIELINVLIEHPDVYLVLVVVLKVLLTKLLILFISNYADRYPLLVPTRRSKNVFLLSFAASIGFALFSLTCKLQHNTIEEILAYFIVYTILIYWDYHETKEVIEKLKK